MSSADILRSTGYTIGRRVRVIADGPSHGKTGTVVGGGRYGPVIYLRIQIDGEDAQIQVQAHGLEPESGTVRAAP